MKEKPKLSQREREIAILASEGLTNKEISEKLGINSRALLKQALS